MLIARGFKLRWHIPCRHWGPENSACLEPVLSLELAVRTTCHAPDASKRLTREDVRKPRLAGLLGKTVTGLTIGTAPGA
jgi:hypothetical protein